MTGGESVSVERLFLSAVCMKALLDAATSVSALLFGCKSGGLLSEVAYSFGVFLCSAGAGSNFGEGGIVFECKGFKLKFNLYCP